MIFAESKWISFCCLCVSSYLNLCSIFSSKLSYNSNKLICRYYFGLVSISLSWKCLIKTSFLWLKVDDVDTFARYCGKSFAHGMVHLILEITCLLLFCSCSFYSKLGLFYNDVTQQPNYIIYFYFDENLFNIQIRIQ